VTDIDWDALRAAAAEAAEAAYAPYSDLRVGAAGLVDDGRIVTGCNVENASFGLTLCAECGLVSELHRSGGGFLLAVSCVSPDSRTSAEGDEVAEHLMPCGRCRQLLYEAGGPDLLVDGPFGPMSMDELLPHAFGPESLPE
jgi:cytidine deaminase